MTFEEAVAFLDDRAKWGMRPGTERIAAIVGALGHPQRSYPVVHVAGTNGKFSVVSMTASILGALGLTVGTYTSPHLETVRERIAVGGEPIAPEDFGSVLAYLRPYLEAVEAERDDKLTYFETLTAMGFEWFFDRGVHAAVLETGLGGEYDATNVADGRVAVITNVGADHLSTFGDLETAAWEKAGVLKPGSVAVCGVEPGDLLAIVEQRARERDATLHVLGADVEVVDRRPGVGGQSVTVRTPRATYADLFVPAYGPHQATNAALAVTACEAFVDDVLARESLTDGLALVHLPGRMEVAGRRPLIVLDGAHNPPGASAAATALRESFTYRRLIGVAAMFDDKAVEEVLETIGTMCDAIVVSSPRAERAAPAGRLAEVLRRLGVLDITTTDSMDDALAAAIEAAAPEDLVFVFGNLWAVGEARSWLRHQGLLPQR